MAEHDSESIEERPEGQQAGRGDLMERLGIEPTHLIASAYVDPLAGRPEGAP